MDNQFVDSNEFYNIFNKLFNGQIPANTRRLMITAEVNEPVIIDVEFYIKGEAASKSKRFNLVEITDQEEDDKAG